MPGQHRVRKAWSLYPNLHATVIDELADTDLTFSFHPHDDEHACIREHDTNIMGRFTCHNRACETSGWSSKRIAVTIRLYPGTRYNARVYFQRCKRCRSLSKPTLDQSYAERVAYRLKKWSGVDVEQPEFRQGRERRPPHKSDLCEGCKNGHCSQLVDELGDAFARLVV